LSKKLKFEPGKTANQDTPSNPKPDKDKKKKAASGGGNSDTPNTDRYLASQIKKTGKTKAALVKDLRCNNCGQYHGVIAKDCKNPKVPDAGVNSTVADLKPGWDQVEEIDTPEHLRGFFSVLAIDSCGVEPSHLGEIPKKKKSRKKKKKEIIFNFQNKRELSILYIIKSN
jgi:hypothetical protein